MSPETYAHVSNLVIPTATVIYALAMVSHAMEWATRPRRGREDRRGEANEVLVACRRGNSLTAALATYRRCSGC